MKTYRKSEIRANAKIGTMNRGRNNDVRSISIFRSCQFMWEEFQDNPERDDIEYHFTEEKAIEAAGNIKLYLGFSPVVEKITIEYNDFNRAVEFGDDIELDQFTEIGKGYYDTETVWEGIPNTGDSIEGSVVVMWSWEKYVGYSRKIEGLRFGGYKEVESELILGNENSISRTNAEVLVSAEDLEGLTDDQKIDLIVQKLDSDAWKWSYFGTADFEALAEDDLDLFRK